jgi:hypothetical protein
MVAQQTERPTGIDQSEGTVVSTQVVPGTVGETAPLNTPEMDEEIRLPSGQALDQNRGYGEDNVFRTPGIDDRSDVEYVLNHPAVDYRSGAYDIVIGDNPNGPGQIGIWLLGGVPVKATNYEPIEDVLGRIVHIDKDDEHATRGGERISDSELKQIIRNPSEIWEGSGHDYYVGQLNDGSWIIVKVYTGLNNVVYVSTTIPRETQQDVANFLRNSVNDMLRRIYPQ